MNWKRFTSRKFCAAMLAVVTSMLYAFGATENTVAIVTGVISLLAYIFAETLVDVKRKPYADITEEGD